MSVQDEQTKEKLELQKGDEKEEWHTPTEKKQKIEFSIFVVVCGLIAIVCLNKGVPNKITISLMAVTFFVYMLQSRGVFSKKQKKKTKIWWFVISLISVVILSIFLCNVRYSRSDILFIELGFAGLVTLLSFLVNFVNDYFERRKIK